jgi:hypothetical protein
VSAGLGSAVRGDFWSHRLSLLLVKTIQKPRPGGLTRAVSSMIFSSNVHAHEKLPDNKTGKLNLAPDGAQVLAHLGCFDMAGSCYRPHPIRFVDIAGSAEPILSNWRTRRASQNKRQGSRNRGTSARSRGEFADGSRDTRNVVCDTNCSCSTPRRTR